MSRIIYKVTNNYDAYRLGYINDYQQKLVKNFLKCCEWVRQNMPNENIDNIHMPHNVYHFIAAEIVDGELYMSYGSHGGGFNTRLSRFGTDTSVQGSSSNDIYRYENMWCARADMLEEFLSYWTNVKCQILETNRKREKLSSDDFEA